MTEIMLIYKKSNVTFADARLIYEKHGIYNASKMHPFDKIEIL